MRKKHEFEVLFVGFVQNKEKAEHIFAADAAPQAAAQRHQLRILKAIRCANIGRIELLSSPPASCYPKNKHRLIAREEIEVDGLKGVSTLLVNLPLVNMLSRATTTAIEIIKWSTRTRVFRRKNSVVFFYAMHTPHLLSAIMARMLGSRVVVYVPDLPIYMRTNMHFWLQLLKKLDAKLLFWLVKRFTQHQIGIVENMRQQFGSTSFSVIDTVSEPKRLSPTAAGPRNGEKIILYTGGLAKASGIGDILPIFATDSELIENGFKLAICGSGQLEDECIRWAHKSPGVEFLGYLPREKITALQRSSFALINMRRCDEDFVKYSLPSKMFEYLESGVPAICSALPTLPDDLRPFLNISEVADLKNLVMHMNNYYETYRAKARKGQQHFFESRSCVAQGKKIEEIFCSLFDGSLESE